ncbi:MAG: hypothetical protein M1522_05420 [Actinobacteria bacterium]|nr:hypothetical protein [Actinomycetota bacterium]
MSRRSAPSLAELAGEPTGRIVPLRPVPPARPVRRSVPRLHLPRRGHGPAVESVGGVAVLHDRDSWCVVLDRSGRPQRHADLDGRIVLVRAVGDRFVSLACRAGGPADALAALRSGAGLGTPAGAPQVEAMLRSRSDVAVRDDRLVRGDRPGDEATVCLVVQGGVDLSVLAGLGRVAVERDMAADSERVLVAISAGAEELDEAVAEATRTALEAGVELRPCWGVMRSAWQRTVPVILSGDLP